MSYDLAMRLIAGLVCLTSITPGQPDARLQGLKRQLDSIAEAMRGTLGYTLHHLKTGDRIERNGDELFRTDSSLKVAIMCAAMEQVVSGKLGYRNLKTLIDSDRTGGSGFFQNYNKGAEIELKEAVHQMIVLSDNTATLLVMRWIGGTGVVNEWLQRNGLKKTRLIHPYPISPELEKNEAKIEEIKREVVKWGMGVSTPNEMRQLMEMVADGRAGRPAATDQMWRVLSHQYHDAGIASQIPPWVSAASKSGRSPEGRSDMAIVSSPSGIYVLTIFTQGVTDSSGAWQNQVQDTIRAMSKAVWRHYHPADNWSPPAGAEKLW